MTATIAPPAAQLSLFQLQPLNRIAGSKPRTIAAQFEAFHAANPGVYQALRRLALDMRRRGVRSYGMKGLFEILRWQYALQTQGEPYKLNNNYTSHYARLLMKNEPALAHFFETRQQRKQ